MALHGLPSDSATMLTQLGLWALRALLLAVCAACGLAALRVKSVSTRLFTWTAVLYAAFAIPALGWLLPSLPVPTPLRVQDAALPAPPVIHVTTHVARYEAPILTGNQSGTVAEGAGAIVPRQTESAEPLSIPWAAIALAFYLAICLMLLARLAVGFALSRRLVKAGQRIVDERVRGRVQTSAGRFRFAPPVYESKLISVPVTIGAIRPVILLPPSWREWEPAKRDAILAHEMSHVARHDGLTQSVALLHRAIFWFSPLSWWLHRQLANLAEQASDEAALSSGADRSDYAKTLLGFFAALQAAPRRAYWQGVSMAHAGRAEQRVERILEWRGAVAMGVKKSAVVLIVAAAIPIVYVAAAARPANRHQVSQDSAAMQEPAPTASPDPAGAPASAPDAQAAPTAGPVAPAMPPAPKGGVYIAGPAPVSPVAPVAPVDPAAPVAPVSRWAGQGSGRGFSYAYGFDDEQRFVIVTGKSDSFTMSGTGEDARHVENLRKQIPGDFIWFQRDEKSYIIRDQATIDRARKLWAPQEELGRKQEALGKQQEALGKQQEELGAKMEQVRVNVPDMTAALDRLKAEMQKLGPSATMEQLGKLQSEIGELQSKIGDVQSQAGDQQSKLGEAQGALGEKQGKLGEEQGELGRQQGELARKATLQMKQILDEAIKNGTAKPEPQGADSSTL